MFKTIEIAAAVCLVAWAAACASADETVDIANPSTVTLDVKDAKLADVLAEIAKQTGNKPIETGEETASKRMTLKFEKTPYWEALARICKDAGAAWRVPEGAGGLVLEPAAPGEPKLSFAGPVVFRAASFAEPGADEKGYVGNLKCTVEFFWEDRLTMSAFTPAVVEKVTDSAGNALLAPRGVGMVVGKLSTSGGTPDRRLEVVGGAFSGTFTFWVPKPEKGAALGEISGRLGLVKSGGKIEFRIPGALANGEQSVEMAGYKLTIKSVERREGSVSLVTEFTKDGQAVALPWPGRGGWSLVDAKGAAIEGHLMGGRIATFPMLAEPEGGLTLVRTYCPDAASGTYSFKLEGVPIPK